MAAYRIIVEAVTNIVLDINLPGTSGVEATREIAETAPGTAVLVLTMVDDEDTVYAALAAGAAWLPSQRRGGQ